MKFAIINGSIVYTLISRRRIVSSIIYIRVRDIDYDT